MEDGPFKVRFEGLMWVIKDEPPPVEPPIEPPPEQPTESKTRLAQYGIGASAHREAPESADPYDIRVRPAAYGWGAFAPHVAGPGWVVRATTASWGMLAQGAEIVLERCISKVWGCTFNEHSFNACTWNDQVFGQRRTGCYAAGEM